MNIVLIGMRGAGKSNISRRLSMLSKRPVLSTDLLIEYDNGGRSIPQIISDANGDWKQFREMEYKVVQKVAAMENSIIDCGGGIIVDLDDEGREIYSQRKLDLLKSNGKVVWLKGDIERLAAKVKDDQRRPTLDETRSIQEVMERRMPFYEQAADIVIDIEGRRRRKIARKVYRMFYDQDPPEIQL